MSAPWIPEPQLVNGGPITAPRSAWRATAAVSACFCFLLAIALYIGHARVRAQDPWKSPKLAELKEKLRQSPRDENVKKAIRELDLKLRERYFLQMSRMQTGVYLLLGGVAVFLYAMGQAGGGKQLPNLALKRTPEERLKTAAFGRWSVAAAGVLVAGGFLFAGQSLKSSLPANATAVDKQLGGDAGASGTTAASDAASIEELRKNWTRFLGPDGNNSSMSANPPAKWDVQGGGGVAWKTAVPVPGFNSPIAWGDRVFLSGGDAEKREVICLEAKSGKILWREAVADVPGSPAKMPEIPETTGFAAPSMATDGRRVYVIFANGDLAAFSLEGKRAWTKYVGPVKNAYGHATSLATWRDRLILQFDQGEAEEGKSKLYCIDGRTGQIVWQKQRKAGASWASPAVFEAGGKAQIVVLSLPFAMSYAANDGAELWKVDCLNGEVTPSPIFAGGYVLVASPSEKLLAIKPDGQGDVTKTHVAWTNEDNVPDVTSPASNGQLVFLLTTSGLLTCVDIKDGKKLWEHDYEVECHASPAIAGNKLYVFTQKGGAVVIEASREYKELFKTEMGDAFHASPAFVDDRMFVRGVTNVWCLSAGQK